ncbi:hypothetical protein SK128_018616 [Halocaridina rubra]|uniref:Uncharacterized protein n=1 Tax=Halocaridina rubra TaxID=373956 RepID=A0AAN8WRK1_HALRR
MVISLDDKIRNMDGEMKENETLREQIRSLEEANKAQGQERKELEKRIKKLEGEKSQLESRISKQEDKNKQLNDNLKELDCVVDRILEPWNALVLYFQGAVLEDHLESIEKIYGALTNPVYKMYFKFLSYILPVVTKMNKEFQGEGVQIHHALDKVCALYRSVLSNYTKREVLDTLDIFAVNHHDPHNSLSEKTVHFGTKVQRMLVEAGSCPTIEASLVSGFRVKCLNFYVEIATFLSVLDHKLSISKTMRDLTELLGIFPNLVSEPLHDAVNDD